MYNSSAYNAASGAGADPMKEVIALGACQAHELLPQSPDLPADVFTACLTTPIKVHGRTRCCHYHTLCCGLRRLYSATCTGCM